MTLRTPTVFACSLILASGLAFGAAHSNSWQQGVVRDVSDSYAHIAVVQQRGVPGLIGQGGIRQFCTVELGDKLYFGERDSDPQFEYTRFVAVDSSNVAVRVKNGVMTLKDRNGHQRSFEILRTLPNTPENEPDPTAFAARAMEIQ
jgi:hypothetical protein